MGLIHWRNYHIGGDELERVRDTFLAQQVDTPTVIESEYLDAKARYEGVVRAETAWLKRAGLLKMRDVHEAAAEGEGKAALQLANTKPTTPAGAAALLAFVAEDELDMGVPWHAQAIATVIRTLLSWSEGTQHGCGLASNPEMAAQAKLYVDPTFAAIEAHRLAYEAVNVEIVKTDEFEAMIAKDRRKTLHIEDGAVETDDPRWLAHLRTLHELHDAESSAECVLADIVPTTTAGVRALLKYGSEVEERSTSWNDLVDPDDESVFHRRVGRSWHYFVNRNIVKSLEGLPA